MAENSKKTNRKRSNRKAEETDSLGIHKIPVDIVEIERNMIENWLLHAKHWIKHNIELARKVTLSVLGSFIFILLLVLIHNAVTQQHNRNFYDYLGEYQSAAGSPEGLSTLQGKTEKLCNSFWGTSGSQSACLLNSLLTAKTKSPAEAAELLEHYTNKLGNNGLGAFFRFYTGYYHESAGNFDEALKHYRQLQAELATIEQEDLAIFHVGRILYYQGDLVKAKELFVSLVEHYPAGSFTGQAKKYISIISLKSGAGEL